jgi:hypothetical protein
MLSLAGGPTPRRGVEGGLQSHHPSLANRVGTGIDVTSRCSDPFVARLFAACSAQPGRNSGLLCSFCADGGLRSQWQETVDNQALLNRLPADFRANRCCIT